ncbi:hypothetical protein J3P95_22690 [Pseudomonas sp. Z5-35]|uniref:hypothetical protein n=1 Tax=unclassified Pseudomonas TaxID=196821 RepID=UPI003DAA4A59
MQASSCKPQEKADRAFASNLQLAAWSLPLKKGYKLQAASLKKKQVALLLLTCSLPLGACRLKRVTSCKPQEKAGRAFASNLQLAAWSLPLKLSYKADYLPA